MSSQRRDFFMSKPVKKSVFWSKPFYMRTEFWEQITFFVETALFKKQKDRKTPVYCTRPVMFKLPVSCMVGKRGGLEKCDQDMKIILTSRRRPSKKFLSSKRLHEIWNWKILKRSSRYIYIQLQMMEFRNWKKWHCCYVFCKF